MATVYHPTFPEVSNEVADKDVKDWTEQGWRKTPLNDDAAPPNDGTPAAK